MQSAFLQLMQSSQKFWQISSYIKMSVCKADVMDFSKEKTQFQSNSGKGPSDPVGKYFKGYSSMVFLRRGKHKRRPSRSNPCNLSKEIQENEKKSLNVTAKKGEVLGLEEVSNEFTCDSSLMESYHLTTAKEARFRFRKLEDGTFALETKHPNESEKSESGLIKRSSKSRQKKGHHSHKPPKICFKKSSKTFRKPSNDDSKPENPTSSSMTKQQNVTSFSEVTNQEENSLQVESTGRAWATFKRLVTRRRKTHSSLKRQSQLSARNLESNVSATSLQRVSKKKRFSNLRIPCMKFSKGKRSSNIALTSEEPPCTKPSSENCTESVSDYRRSDNALAAKYRLQRSLEVENGNLDICTEVCPKSKTTLDQKDEKTCEIRSLTKLHINQDINSSEEKKSDFQQTHSGEQDSILNMNLKLSPHSPGKGANPLCENLKGFTNLQSTQLPNGPLLNDETSILDEDQRDNSNFHSDCEDEHSLENDVSAILDPNSDLYEFLLMRTAASLVSKVIQSSIRQIAEENALLNHGPGKASQRFYV